MKYKEYGIEIQWFPVNMRSSGSSYTKRRLTYAYKIWDQMVERILHVMAN